VDVAGVPDRDGDVSAASDRLSAPGFSMRFCRVRIVNRVLSRQHRVFSIAMSQLPMISAMRHWKIHVSHRDPACGRRFARCFHSETAGSDESRLISTGNRLVGIANNEFSMETGNFGLGTVMRGQPQTSQRCDFSLRCDNIW